MGDVASVSVPLPGTIEATDPRDPVQVLGRFYRAFNDRNLALMETVWYHSAETSVVSPLVGLVRGWPAIRSAYEQGFRSAMHITTEFYDYTVHPFGDVFSAVGRARARSTTPSGSVEVVGQATNILRRSPDGSWKLVHHHVSVAGPQGLVRPPRGERAAVAPPHG
jgi:ketosteroid isomerase-like protein